MRSQISSFLVYPLIVGFFIVMMKTDGLQGVMSSEKEHTFYDDFQPDYSGPLYTYDPFLKQKNLSSYNDLNYHDYSLAFIAPKSFIAFKEAVGFKESGGSYSTVNTLGYMGKYQFGALTLRHFGIYDSNYFLSSPAVQERIFTKYLRYNKKALKKYIKKYEGKNVAGIKVTESGILAAAHLAGSGGVRKFLRSNGRKSSKDAYGSSVKHYMKKFGGYDLEEAIP